MEFGWSSRSPTEREGSGASVGALSRVSLRSVRPRWGRDPGRRFHARSETFKRARFGGHDHRPRTERNTRSRKYIREQNARWKRQQPAPPRVGSRGFAIASRSTDKLRGRNLDHGDGPIDALREQPDFQ